MCEKCCQLRVGGALPKPRYSALTMALRHRWECWLCSSSRVPHEHLSHLCLSPNHRRDDAYWPEAKRAALEDRYHSDFSRQDRFHDFDHRDRGRYPNHSVDRREGSRSMMGDREGQHYPERHGGPERHGRDSRDGWGYGSNKRLSEGRGLPPPPRFVSLLRPWVALVFSLPGRT